MQFPLPLQTPPSPNHNFPTGKFQKVSSALATIFPTGPNATFCRWVADAVGADLNDGVSPGMHYTSFTQVNDPITHVGKDDFLNNDLGLYFEDIWKVKPSLTLNLGVRYDIQMVPQPPQANTATPLLNLFTSTLNTDSNNFAPRIGIAWQPTKKTVVRAGYGMFYGKTPIAPTTRSA
jgi:outer membrane receptor protein involved in Fe transport